MRRPRFRLRTLMVALAGASLAARLSDDAEPVWRVLGATGGAFLGAMLVQGVSRSLALTTTAVGLTIGVAYGGNWCDATAMIFPITGALIGLAIGLIASAGMTKAPTQFGKARR